MRVDAAPVDVRRAVGDLIGMHVMDSISACPLRLVHRRVRHMDEPVDELRMLIAVPGSATTLHVPRLAVIRNGVAAIPARMRSTVLAWSAAGSLSAITNSSPPSRPMTASPLQFSRSTAPTPTSASSPAACPRVSLSFLNWSRSMIVTFSRTPAEAVLGHRDLVDGVVDGAPVEQTGERIAIGVSQVDAQRMHQRVDAERHPDVERDHLRADATVSAMSPVSATSRLR